MKITWNSLFMGQTLLEYNRLDSTNSEAERLLSQKRMPEGSLIIAHEQYAGRGQMGSTWYGGENKNLTASFIIYPKIDFPAQQFLLNQMASLALMDVLLSLHVEGVQVKWPNDILINGKKIAGILIQNAISNKGISHCILGVGLNVNQEQFPIGTGNPTSIFMETGAYHTLSQILEALCPALEQRYLQLSGNGAKRLGEDYHHHLYYLNETRTYERADGTKFTGIITGVSASGLLNVKTYEGLEEFYFKQIIFV